MGLEAGIQALWLGFAPPGRELGLEAGIWASRLGFELWYWILDLEAGIFSHETGIWASRLELAAGIKPQGRIWVRGCPKGGKVL